MKLELTITDSRAVSSTGYSYASEKREDYTRAETTTNGSARVVADVLRALANEIDPPPQGATSNPNSSWTLR